ncbi:MAG TPA: threonine synthase [Candidatus Omnitrophota bacterium]|nr:threonine synthase [Candidatus Omnitrophota bacterium]
MIYSGLINKYRKYLPVSGKTPVITLNEGNTPLIHAPYLSAGLGKGFQVYLKYEGANPTGSFKDRGMTMAISQACEEGVKAVICASTGNTSASAAAYAAKAGLRCVVLIPNGHIALGKLSQALIHGAIVLQVDGNFDEALALVKEITEKYPIKMVNSINPFRIEGQKTASFEIIEALEDAPDFQVMPVGNAGNITAYWKGYKEYHTIGMSKKLPRMLGFQAEGAAPIVRGHPIQNPETIATAIRIGNPASWKQAVAARDESKGLIDCVSDDQILEAYKLLALKEGVFAEPASCASIAGLQKLSQDGYFKKQASAGGAVKIVCILTGHGLKDPDRAIKCIKTPKTVKPDMKAILAEIGF